jgi:hypothetical protein
MMRRGAVLAGLLALVVGVSGCAAANGGQSPGAPPPSADIDRTTQAAMRVEGLCQDRFPDRYAGLELRPGVIVVYRKPSPQLDDAVRALVPGFEVSFRDAPYSQRELQPLRDRITADIDYWKGRGITVSTVGVKNDGTAVVVGTAQVDLAKRELPARYGNAPPVLVVERGPISTLST